MEIKNLIYQTGKILYKIVEVPFKAIIGNYSTESQEKIKEIKHDIEQWQIDVFEREKCARQDLGLSFTNELVYLQPTQP